MVPETLAPHRRDQAPLISIQQPIFHLAPCVVLVSLQQPQACNVKSRTRVALKGDSGVSEPAK